VRAGFLPLTFLFGSGGRRAYFTPSVGCSPGSWKVEFSFASPAHCPTIALSRHGKRQPSEASQRVRAFRSQERMVYQRRTLTRLPLPNSGRPTTERATPNPNGIASFSPGLSRRRDYPGKRRSLFPPTPPGLQQSGASRRFCAHPEVPRQSAVQHERLERRKSEAGGPLLLPLHLERRRQCEYDYFCLMCVQTRR
jgi:hypothetical protein